MASGYQKLIPLGFQTADRTDSRRGITSGLQSAPTGPPLDSDLHDKDSELNNNATGYGSLIGGSINFHNSPSAQNHSGSNNDSNTSSSNSVKGNNLMMSLIGILTSNSINFMNSAKEQSENESSTRNHITASDYVGHSGYEFHYTNTAKETLLDQTELRVGVDQNITVEKSPSQLEYDATEESKTDNDVTEVFQTENNATEVPEAGNNVTDVCQSTNNTTGGGRMAICVGCVLGMPLNISDSQSIEND